MKSKIISHEKGIEIEIEDIEDQRTELLEAFDECREGRCSCPTQEYKKVESLEIENSKGKIQLSIRSKTHEEIDPKEIEKCLEYTRGRISEK
ncbi:MAG: hypothetical protein KDI63_14190 [Gammaproteobacteria bacterium]|nr:hypothetical protein [Gammaproteobacteria bacterium]